MKNTGIVRRIDDFGRVVIPKEIRHTFDITIGDPLELHIDGEYVCFKKHDMSIDLLETINRLEAKIRVDLVYDKQDEIIKKLEEAKELLKLI